MVHGSLPTYPDCPIQRQTPTFDINKEFAEKVGREADVLPLFEKTFYEHKYRNFYSLRTNELLNCRWRSYVKNYGDRVIAPFIFVDIRDIHFYNGLIRLQPSLSHHLETKFPFKMGVGPGVDFRGQMPIPQELIQRRGEQKPKNKGKVFSKKAKNEDQRETKKKN